MALDAGIVLLVLGLFLFAGYLAHVGGALVHVPKVTIMLVLGAVAGPAVLDLIPQSVQDWFPLVTHMALGMVGFLLGENFMLRKLRGDGRRGLFLSVGESVLTSAVVFLVLLATSPLTGAGLALILVLAGLAPASAPAATYETAREGKASGPLTDTVLEVVAVDDAWGVIIFSVLVVVAGGVAGSDANAAGGILEGLWEVLGAVLVGAAVGLPMAWITPRVRGGETTLVEAMAFVFVGVGVATILDTSYLLASMTIGAVVANLTHGSRRPFHALEGVSEPFLAIFFLLSGFELRLETLTTVGLVGVFYVGARFLGKVGGAYAAGRIVGLEAPVARKVGFCILPQAGVALGFALLAQDQIPEVGDAALNLVVATTVVFELAGPIAERMALKRAGELHLGNREAGGSE